MPLHFGDCVLDPARRELLRHGQPVHLEPQVFDLLLYLIKNRDHVVSKDELLAAVWQGRIVSESTLSTRVNAARRAIGDSGERQEFIRTTARRGLRFVAEVQQHGTPAERVPGPDAGRVAIAVLPFANVSGDPAQAYLSEGLSADIITDLCRWPQLAVRSRSASFRYRDAALELVARELKVRYLVEGSLQRRGERLRVSAQLVDAESGSHVWADRFDRRSADFFSVQDEVVRTIVATLVGRARVADAERARRRPPATLAAYEFVLQGNALRWDDPEDAAGAMCLFEQAIEADPGYGYAYALLAVMRFRAWQDDLSGSDAALDDAHRLAQRSVNLAADESTCFATLSQICLLQRSFDLAIQHMEHAIELNPTNQWNMANMGRVLSYVGRAEEGLAWFRRARESDPYFDPPWYWHSLGRAHIMLRNHSQALHDLARSPARSYRLSACKACCHVRLGDIDRARAFAAECLRIKPDFTISRWISKEPFKDPQVTAHFVESARAAGLPG